MNVILASCNLIGLIILSNEDYANLDVNDCEWICIYKLIILSEKTKLKTIKRLAPRCYTQK